MEEQTDDRWEFAAEILPDNERTAEIMKKREDKEKMLKIKQEEIRQMEEKLEKKKRQKEQSEQAERLRKEKQKLDNEARKKEEEEEQNKLEGRLRTMLVALQESETPFEYSLSGMDLGAPRCRLLAANIAYNTTLLSLHLARKDIQDDEGQDDYGDE